MPARLERAAAMLGRRLGVTIRPLRPDRFADLGRGLELPLLLVVQAGHVDVFHVKHVHIGRQGGQFGGLLRDEGHQLGGRQHAIDQSHALRLTGVKSLAKQQLFSGALVAGDARQQHA